MVQYGPVSIFPRALALPAGPPNLDAALITCIYLAGTDPAGTAERLLLEALADLKARNATRVEAFGLRHDESVPLEDRFLGHHTLLDRTFLEGLGFLPVRTRGQVSVMRLELDRLIPGPGLAERAANLFLAKSQRRPAPA